LLEPKIIPRAAHRISRKEISDNALKVLYRLNESGFAAYLVGGGVRDLLLGLHPKDFDVATDAHPEQIQKTFRNCRLIGRRFRLAHVYFRDGVVEVATFRSAMQEGEGVLRHSDTGMIMRDNVYGTLEEDAWRRDFTINALYYNIADFSVVDFTCGMEDLQQRVIRMIGDPYKRYHEDPVRMLRAVRFAAKLDFTIEPDTGKPILALAGLLQNVPVARLFEEILKLYEHGKSLASFQLLRHYGLFALLFPQTETCLAGASVEILPALLMRAFQDADTRWEQNKSLHPAYLFAVLLWFPLQKAIQDYQAEGMKFFPAMFTAMEKVIRHQNKSLQVPRRLASVMKEIWVVQYRLSQVKRYAKRAQAMSQHPRFRAAYDFLVLRSKSDELVADAANWWTQYQIADETQRKELLVQLTRKPK
jgi:poly(A) polymerase